eukprot:6447410-Prymnesium_polylepis.1
MVEDHIDELRAEGFLGIRQGLHTAKAGLTTCGQLCTHNHYPLQWPCGSSSQTSWSWRRPRPGRGPPSPRSSC